MIELLIWQTMYFEKINRYREQASIFFLHLKLFSSGLFLINDQANS